MKPNQLLALVSLNLLAGCWHADSVDLVGSESQSPADFRFVGRSSPCFLELPDGLRVLRVNCFHVDGRLHILSNRFAKLPRLSGESWVKTLRRNPRVRIAITGHIYSMLATPIEDETRRQAILRDRGYWYAWDGITVFSYAPRGLH